MYDFNDIILQKSLFYMNYIPVVHGKATIPFPHSIHRLQWFYLYYVDKCM